jgi:hypothetical protein
MEWILLVIIAGASASGTVNSTTVPMATVEHCNAARDKLLNALKVYQSPNYAIIAECLQSR